MKHSATWRVALYREAEVSGGPLKRCAQSEHRSGVGQSWLRLHLSLLEERRYCGI